MGAAQQMRKVITPSDRQRLARLLHAVQGGLECLHSGAAPLSGEGLARLLRHVQVLVAMLQLPGCACVCVPFT